jgi:hypothetical protein
MLATYAEFRLESSTMNTREFYASRQGTQRYLTREAVACAISYSEILTRDKTVEWASLNFDFDCTPAVPVRLQSLEVVYKAGDDPNAGLLRYGRQDMLMPGSVFRFVAWGNVPALREGQIILIGKKRAAARMTVCRSAEVEPDTSAGANRVMPIQVPPLELRRLEAFSPLVLTARYAIIQIPLRQNLRRIVVEGWAVPIVS